MDIYTNHKRLYGIALCFYLFLTFIVAILPAFNAENNNAPLPNSRPLTKLESDGKLVFIAEGCTACHTQQVRNVDMDKIWGGRPSIAADYSRITRTDLWRNTATLMGSERTGPDLTNIGLRQPSQAWHLLHLYNPRSVVEASVMPSYQWLFIVKDYPFPEDVVVHVPDEFRKGVTGSIVASTKLLALIAYLKSLKQVSLPDGSPVPVFLYSKSIKTAALGNAVPGTNAKTEIDGSALYAANCQSCHQENGLGLAGAFPPLKGSKVVLNPDPDVQVTIIMKGYSGRVNEGYGIMPPVGTNNNLRAEEVAAIINHERSSWGNTSSPVTAEQVRKIIGTLKQTATSK